MTLIETQQDRSGLSMAIDLAEEQLTEMTSFAQKALADIKAGDLEAARDVAKAADELRKLLRLAIEMEVRHERERKRDAGYTRAYGLDLAKARSEVRCKLGRLRKCQRSVGVPE